jgi:hypothetical protein
VERFIGDRKLRFCGSCWSSRIASLHTGDDPSRTSGASLQATEHLLRAMNHLWPRLAVPSCFGFGGSLATGVLQDRLWGPRMNAHTFSTLVPEFAGGLPSFERRESRDESAFVYFGVQGGTGPTNEGTRLPSSIRRDTLQRTRVIVQSVFELQTHSAHQ